MKYIIIIFLFTATLSYSQGIRYDENGIPRRVEDSIEEIEPEPFDTVQNNLQEIEYYESKIVDLYIQTEEALSWLKTLKKEMIRLDVVLQKEMNASYSGPMMGLKKYKNDSLITIKPVKRSNGTIRINQVLEPIMEITTREEAIVTVDNDSIGTQTITDTTYIEQLQNIGSWKVNSRNSGTFQGSKYYRVINKNGKVYWRKEDDKKIWFK